EDVHPLLALMLKQWDKVFKENLGYAGRALVSELHETRNNWAHQSPFSTDDAYRTLDSIARLLKNISAPDADIVEIEKQKQEVLIILSKEQARYEVRHTSVSSAEESKIRKKLAELLQTLPFQDASLLNTALTHRTYFYENPKYAREDNERLEFLGDAVLTFLSSEFLYNLDSEKDEGELTRLRSNLVDEKQLAKFATDLDIGKWMWLGKGETESGGSKKLSLLSNTFEAIIGAYFLDSGMESVRSFIKPLFEAAIKEPITFESDGDSKNFVDSKNRFQEWVQANSDSTPPKYVTIHAGGAPHKPEYLAKVYVGEKQYGEGTGSSKKEAEKQAAEDALARLKKRGLI
ncbi:MAG TPA: ribonuclease III, partial [Kamptonema sp.]|nr:ribonuclease III [Kamptonema sp.]